MTEQILSQRVVGSRVIGSANPFMTKLRAVGQKAGAIFAAPILIIIAIVLLFYSEKFQRKSEVIAELPLETASEATVDSGMHKLTGVAEIVKSVSAPEVGEVLYYSYSRETYEQVEKTETETQTVVENGQEVEKTIETKKLVDEWVEKESNSEWAGFKLGKYTVEPEEADLEAEFESSEYRLVAGAYSLVTGTYAPVLGDQRIVVDYLKVDSNLIVVGEVSQDKISSGEVFLISNKTDAELTADLKSAETFSYWALKIGTWLLFTMAFTGILGPILALADFIPLVGKAANFVAGIVCGIVAALIVIFGTLIIKFWWIILLCFGGLIVLLVVLLVTRKAKPEEKKA